MPAYFVRKHGCQVAIDQLHSRLFVVGLDTRDRSSSPLPHCRIESPKVAPVFIINLFLGWTLIGWVAASVLAVWFKLSKSQP